MNKDKELFFVQDAIYDGKCVFKMGETAVLPDDNGFASRWIRRGIAVDATDKKALEKAVEKVEQVEAKTTFTPVKKGKGKNKVQEPSEETLETGKQPEQTEDVAQNSVDPVDL